MDKTPGTLNIEQANLLVEEHQGWAYSIARRIAQCWNLDWQQDGLDGAASEALIFCARRFDPSRNVPFKAYARKRIHEAASEAARRSKGWKRKSDNTDDRARNISVDLLNVFPELREGQLPGESSNGDGFGDEGEVRASIRTLLIGATIIAAKQDDALNSPEQALEYKRLIEKIADLEPIHQSILWKLYWEGGSLRSIADEWDLDELNIVREHKAILEYLEKTLSTKAKLIKLRIRPGLKNTALKFKKKPQHQGEFSSIIRQRRS